METIATDLSKTWTSSSLSWNMVFGSCSNVSLTYLRSISHYLRQLTSHNPKYLLLWSAIMNQGPSSISQYFVFAALLSAHPLSSVEIGEIWPSGGSGRLCSQITDPAFSSSEVAHCQTRALLSVSS